MKKKKYLPLYEKWMKTGSLPGKSGLCKEFDNDDLFTLFKPTSSDYIRIQKNREPYAWWANDDFGQIGQFTDTRKNIVLLMAALNNEL